MLITTPDLIGTFAFAVTGCFKAIKHELDLLGFVILGLMTGIGGGIVRDIILGVPPVALTDESVPHHLPACGRSILFFVPAYGRTVECHFAG